MLAEYEDNAVALHSRPRQRSDSLIQSTAMRNSGEKQATAVKLPESWKSTEDLTESDAGLDALDGAPEVTAVHAADQAFSARDCLCEDYYNECHVTIHDGCQIALVQPCKTRSANQRTRMTSHPAPSVTVTQFTTPKKNDARKSQLFTPADSTCASQVNAEQNDDIDLDTGQRAWLLTHGKKKDPDYDVDVSSCTPAAAVTALTVDISDTNYSSPSDVAVKPASVDSPVALSAAGADDRHVTCHPGCRAVSNQNCDVNAIEECFPTEAATRNDAPSNSDVGQTAVRVYKLEHLNLSGCLLLTDVGLRWVP